MCSFWAGGISSFYVFYRLLRRLWPRAWLEPIRVCPNVKSPLRKKGGTSTGGRSSSEIAIVNLCVGNVRMVTYTL
jgi:hypothetical protein